VIHNRKGGVTAYSITDTTLLYDNFEFSDVEENLLEEAQNIIGSYWRSVFTGTVTADTFYVLKDDTNNYYKIRFLDLVNSNGERGYLRFEYSLLK